MQPIKDKKILALETCTNICSVALWDGQTMRQQVVEKERSHSKKILPMCREVLSEANLSVADLDAIACTRGPGAFTGVRIGVAVAKGMAYGQDLPIYALSSLQVLAYAAMQSDDAPSVLALLDARMGELYAATYDNINGYPQLVGKESLTDIEQLALKPQGIAAGTGAACYQQQIIAKGGVLSSVLYPMASDIIALIHRANISCDSAATLSPVYLRDKVTD